jgi:hypothetical protein
MHKKQRPDHKSGHAAEERSADAIAYVDPMSLL